MMDDTLLQQKLQLGGSWHSLKQGAEEEVELQS